MKLTEGELEFNFTEVIDGFKFDEKDKFSAHYHGLSHCMKGVDYIIELPDEYLFIEVKDPSHSESADERHDIFKNKVTSGTLLPELRQKYRDTFLYRWAENKVDKPIHYICLITLESPLVLHLMQELKRQLPEGKASSRWQQGIVSSCIVVNIELWNQQFTKWPIARLSA